MTQFFRSICITLLIGLLTACANEPLPSISSDAKLRMGLYKGSPTSILPGKTFDDSKGVGFEIGKALAEYFDVSYSPIIFEKNADVLNAAKQGRVDVVFTNASAERAKDFAFSEPVLKIEKGYLVGSQRGIQSISDIDVEGKKIGVSEGSSSQQELSKIIKKAHIVTTTSSTSAIAMLKAGRIDAFSSNKAILYEMSDSVPGSKVLPDVIGYEFISIGIPKEKSALIPKINDWIKTMKAGGKIDPMVQRAGLRGVAH